MAIQPTGFAAVVAGIRPRGFGAGTYTLKTPTGSGVEYFVDGATGNDANDGSEGTPWATIDKAASTAVAGDVVTIEDGNYDESVTNDNGGTVTNRIVFQARNRGGVVMTGSANKRWQPASWTGQFMKTTGEKYITVKGITFNLYGSESSGNHALRMITGWTCEDCWFDDAAWVAVQIEGDDCTVDRCTIENTFLQSIGAFATDNPALIDDPVNFPYIERILVRDTILRNNGTAGQQGVNGQKFLHTDHATWENCEGDTNHGPTIWFDSQNKNMHVRDCYIHDALSSEGNYAGFGIHMEISFGPMDVHNCVFLDNTDTAIFLNSSGNAQITGNYFSGNAQCVTFVHEDSRVEATGAGVVFGNFNIQDNWFKDWTQHTAVHTLGGDFGAHPSDDNIVCDYNRYEKGTAQLAFWEGIGNQATIANLQTNLGWEAHGIETTIPAIGTQVIVGQALAAGTDDGYHQITGTDFGNNTASTARMGHNSNFIEAFFRWRPLATRANGIVAGLNQGETVSAATIQFHRSGTNNNAITLEIGCYDEDNAAAPVDATDLRARAHTTAVTVWDLAAGVWDAAADPVSADFAASINEVLARAGWTPASHLVVYVRATAGTANQFYSLTTRDSSATQCALLSLTASVTEEQITSPIARKSVARFLR